MRLLFVSRSFAVSEGWIDVCVVILGCDGRGKFRPRFSTLTVNSAAFGALFAALISRMRGNGCARLLFVFELLVAGDGGIDFCVVI